MISPGEPEGQQPEEDVRPVDGTPSRRVELHRAKYGDHAINYKQAFDLSIPAVLADENGETPRAIIAMDADASGRPMTKDELDQKMREIVAAGDFELLPVDETNENEDDPAKNWIFAVHVNTDSDEQFWAAVDRDTGQVLVTGFN
jgi:hypothetical protein